MVFSGPVEHRVDEVPPRHGPLAGKLVAAAAAVGEGTVVVLPEKVIGHGLVEGIFVPVGVVVDHIHHHADSRGMERGDHLPALPQPDFAPGGVGGIAALGHVVVCGVVAPVVLPGQGLGLVHAAEIEDRHQLDVAYAQPPQIAQAGGVDAIVVQSRALLGEGKVFAPPRRMHAAGRILREIPHRDLPHRPAGRRDAGADVLRPALRRDPGGIHDHAAGAVHTGSGGVGVAGLAHRSVGVDRKGIIMSVLVAGQVDRPHALFLLFQGERPDAHPAVAPAVEVDRDLLRRGCPKPEVGPGGGVLRPKGAVVSGLLREGFTLKQRLPFRRGFHSDFILRIIIRKWDPVLGIVYRTEGRFSRLFLQISAKYTILRKKRRAGGRYGIHKRLGRSDERRVRRGREVEIHARYAKAGRDCGADRRPAGSERSLAGTAETAGRDAGAAERSPETAGRRGAVCPRGQPPPAEGSGGRRPAGARHHRGEGRAPWQL